MKIKKMFKKLSKGIAALALTAVVAVGIMAVTSNATTLYIAESITLTANNNTYSTSAEYEEAGNPIFRMHVSGVTAGNVKISNTMRKFTTLWYKDVETVTARNITGPKYIDYYFNNKGIIIPKGYTYFKIQIPYFSNSNAKVTINGGYTRME